MICLRKRKRKTFSLLYDLSQTRQNFASPRTLQLAPHMFLFSILNFCRFSAKSRTGMAYTR